MNTTTIQNRLTSLFDNKPENVLSIYYTAGFPGLNDTKRILKALSSSGADIVEIGIPFSDPVADGPTIQDSSTVALKNGMTLELLFKQLKGVRSDVDVPIILMGYLNPIYQYGVEAFCSKCAEIGIDGVILPDLPMQEYLTEYKSTFEKYNLLNIFLVTPQTSGERIREIDHNTNGFIYLVSSASTTGAKKEISEEQVEYFKRVKSMKLQNPLLIGFGISNKDTFDRACQYANGAIIGSAFINILNNSKNLEEDITNYVQSVIN